MVRPYLFDRERWEFEHQRLLRDVRKLHLEGMRDRAIAERLGISPRTVGRYREELGLPRRYAPHSKLNYPKPWQRKAAPPGGPMRARRRPNS